MFWLAFPLFASIFYTVAGYIQNYLIDNTIRKGKAGSYIIIRIVGHLCAMMVLLSVFGRAVFMLPLQNAIGMMVAGAINVFAVVYYCKALQKGDHADITIFGQVSPIISLVLGILILGETITAGQGLGFLFIMGAILFVILGGKAKKGGSDIKVAAITIFCAFFSILSDIIYAYFLTGTSNFTLFGQSFFFFELGSVLFIFLSCIFMESWRKAVIQTFFVGKHHKHNFAYAMGENLLYVIGDGFYKLALILAPVKSLVSVTGRVSLMFASLFITIFFGHVFPKFISARRPSKHMMFRYAVASVFIVIGLVMIN